MSKFISILFMLVLPVIVIIIAFSNNILLGVGLLILYILFSAYNSRAGIYGMIGKLKYSASIEEATVWFGKAYKTGKAKPQTAISYGYLLLKSGNIEEAESILSKLAASSTGFDGKMLAKSNLALVLWKKGDINGAVEMLEEVHKDYKNTNIYGSLGYLLLLKDDLDKALQFNLEAFEYNSANSIILDNLGQTYYLRGEYEKAAETYEELMKKNPSFPEAYYNYGLVLLKKNEPQKALDTMKKALNYKLSYLSAVTKDEIESKIEEIEKELDTDK